MNGFLLIVAFAATLSTSFGQNLKECPDIKPAKALPPETLYGVWHLLQIGSAWDEFVKDIGSIDCMTDTYFVHKDSPKDVVDIIYHHRVNESNPGEYHRSTMNVTIDPTNPKTAYTWVYPLFGVDFPTVYMESDGISYHYGYSCVETMPGNYVILWWISSRDRSMDPKLQDSLVAKIQKYNAEAGLPKEKLTGIGQANCN